eukprot:COSAG01_NODE_2128_length_8364_cov_100.246461_5_plen_193_part_00
MLPAGSVLLLWIYTARLTIANLPDSQLFSLLGLGVVGFYKEHEEPPTEIRTGRFEVLDSDAARRDIVVEIKNLRAGDKLGYRRVLTGEHVMHDAYSKNVPQQFKCRFVRPNEMDNGTTAIIEILEEDNPGRLKNVIYPILETPIQLTIFGHSFTGNIPADLDASRHQIVVTCNEIYPLQSESYKETKGPTSD